MENINDEVANCHSRGKSNPDSRRLNAGQKTAQYTLLTLPAFKQLVHTRTIRTLPPCVTFVDCRFGFQRRFVLLCAWLTLQPTMGFLPHISQTLATWVTSRQLFTFKMLYAILCQQSSRLAHFKQIFKHKLRLMPNKLRELQ